MTIETTEVVDFDPDHAEHEIASLEALVQDLGTLSRDLSKRGVGREDAVMLEKTGALPARYPVSSYTQLPSQTNLTVTMESIWDKITTSLDNLWQMFVDMMIKLYDWFESKFRTKASDVKEATKEAEVVKEKFDEDVKAAPAADVANVMEAKEPELALHKENEERTYTDLVRACYLHPMWIVDLLSYHRVIKPALVAVNNYIGGFMSAYGVAGSVKTEEQFLAMVDEVTRNRGEFESVLTEFVEYLLKAKIPGIPFTKQDTPIATLRDIYNAIVNASKRPAKISMTVDFPSSLAQVTKARNIVTDAAVEFERVTDGLKPEYSAISKRLKQLKRLKANDIFRSPYAKANRPQAEEFAKMIKNTMQHIERINTAINTIPNIVNRAVIEHINATIMFMNAARKQL